MAAKKLPAFLRPKGKQGKEGSAAEEASEPVSEALAEGDVVRAKKKKAKKD